MAYSLSDYLKRHIKNVHANVKPFKSNIYYLFDGKNDKEINKHDL